MLFVGSLHLKSHGCTVSLLIYQLTVPLPSLLVKECPIGLHMKMEQLHGNLIFDYTLSTVPLLGITTAELTALLA